MVEWHHTFLPMATDHSRIVPFFAVFHHGLGVHREKGNVTARIEATSCRSFLWVRRSQFALTKPIVQRGGQGVWRPENLAEAFTVPVPETFGASHIIDIGISHLVAIHCSVLQNSQKLLAMQRAALTDCL